MTTGQRIKAARKVAGLTQEELGNLCGMADSAIRRYESGRGNPTQKTLQRIATALGVSVLDLLGTNTPEARQLTERDAQQEGSILAEIEGEAAEQMKDVTLDRDILDMLMLNDSPMDTHKAVIQSMQFLMDGIELDLDEDSNSMIIAEAIIRKNRWKK